MGVGIDEAWGYAALIGVDHCVGQTFGLDFVVRSGGGDAAVFNEKSCVVDDGEVAEFCTGARACGAGEGDELGDVDDGCGHSESAALRAS